MVYNPYPHGTRRSQHPLPPPAQSPHQHRAPIITATARQAIYPFATTRGAQHWGTVQPYYGPRRYPPARAPIPPTHTPTHYPRPAPAATRRIPEDMHPHKNPLEMRMEAQARFEGYLPNGILFGKQPAHYDFANSIEHMLNENPANAVKELEKYYQFLQDIVSDRTHLHYINQKILHLNSQGAEEIVKAWIQFQYDKKAERILSPEGPLGRDLLGLRGEKRYNLIMYYLQELEARPWSKQHKRGMDITRKDAEIQRAKDIENHHLEERLEALRRGETFCPQIAELQSRFDRIRDRTAAPSLETRPQTRTELRQQLTRIKRMKQYYLNRIDRTPKDNAQQQAHYAGLWNRADALEKRLEQRIAQEQVSLPMPAHAATRRIPVDSPPPVQQRAPSSAQVETRPFALIDRMQTAWNTFRHRGHQDDPEFRAHTDYTLV